MTTNSNLTDQELDRLLALAAPPAIPQDFEARFQARLRQAAANNVIAFPLRPASVALKPAHWRLPLAAALAASLIIGVWMGNASQESGLFGITAETAMLSPSNDFAPSGLEDIGALDAGAQS